MRIAMMVLALLAVPAVGQAATDCSTTPTQASQPLRPTVLAPVASELSSPRYRLGVQGGVLSHAYGEAQSVDQVLLRLRVEGCNLARALPAAPGAAVDPLDPSVYKPQTEHDNSPWRFDMSQDGKMMTADEFDAWMQARGVRVARGRPKPVEPELPELPEGSEAAPATAAEAEPEPEPSGQP